MALLIEGHLPAVEAVLTGEGGLYRPPGRRECNPCNRASSPFSAMLTSYPLVLNKSAWLSRTNLSSSTTRMRHSLAYLS